MTINLEDKELLLHIEAYLGLFYRGVRIHINRIWLENYLNPNNETSAIICEIILSRRHNRESLRRKISISEFNQHILPIYRQNKIDDIIT